MTLAERLVKQSDDIDRLFQRVVSLDLQSRFGERYTAFQGSVVFSQGQLVAVPMVFNLPKGNDFRAERLSFFPGIRLISPATATQGPSERTFRPTLYSFQTPLGDPFDQSVDISIELMLGDIALQSAPFCVQQTFSGAMPTQNPFAGSLAVPFAAYETPSALEFPLDMKAGETLTARITSIFTAPVDDTIVDDGRIYQYQIIGCLEGAKVLR